MLGECLFEEIADGVDRVVGEAVIVIGCTDVHSAFRLGKSVKEGGLARGRNLGFAGRRHNQG